jgi:hypothetical protein
MLHNIRYPNSSMASSVLLQNTNRDMDILGIAMGSIVWLKQNKYIKNLIIKNIIRLNLPSATSLASLLLIRAKITATENKKMNLFILKFFKLLFGF